MRHELEHCILLFYTCNQEFNLLKRVSIEKQLFVIGILPLAQLLKLLWYMPFDLSLYPVVDRVNATNGWVSWRLTRSI